MIILGDIGNTVTKICLVKNNKIFKKISVPSIGKKNNILDKHFSKFQFSKLRINLLTCDPIHYPYPKTEQTLLSFYIDSTSYSLECYH